MKHNFKLVLLSIVSMVTVTVGQYHHVTRNPVQNVLDKQTDTQQEKEQGTNNGTKNDTKQCPNVADAMYQTPGPVNIYLHGEYTSNSTGQY